MEHFQKLFHVVIAAQNCFRMQECQCCMEIDTCVEAVNCDQVLMKVESVPSCITLHPGSSSICLQVWSLCLAGCKHCQIDREKYEIKDTEYR